MPAKSLAFHKQQGRVGGQVPFCYLCAYMKKYIYTILNANPNHPLTKQTHSPRSSLWDTKSPNSLPSFSAHTLFCPPSPCFQGWGLMSWTLRRDETRKAGMLTPRVRVQCPLDSRCSTGRRALLLALQQRHRRVCAPNKGQWHDFMFQRSCQKSQWMRVNRQRSEDGSEVNSEKVEQRGGNDNQEYVTDCNK